MRIGIASHIVLDSIKAADDRTYDSIGGPACYCGITSKRFGFDVSLATRIGKDFHQHIVQSLLDERLKISDRQIVDAPTTKFSLGGHADSRFLVLVSKCIPLDPEEIKDTKVDCWLISPVIDEVPPNVFAAIKQNKGKKNFVMLDPQGYMRTVDQAGNITLKDRLELDLSGITALKVDQEEMAALSGGLSGLKGMQYLQSKGIEFVLYTECRIIHLLHKKTHYWFNLQDVDTPDSTGAGDILSAAFCCAYLKEKDPLWAICFGAGALRAALETKRIGLTKIPSMSKIEQSSSYFYNTVGFRQLS